MKSLSYVLSSAAVCMLIWSGPALAQTTEHSGKSPMATESAPSDTAGSGATSVRAPNPVLADLRASKLIGATVYNAQNEAIGDINDLLLDGNGGIDRVVVGVGGFLGMGERNVALKFTEVDVRMDGGSYRAAVPMTKAQLEALPQWKAPANR